MQSDYIKHHGIRGQRWGVRRFQKLNGMFTAEGRKRRQEQKKKYEEKLEEVESKASKVDKVLYGKSTRRKAAKILAENSNVTYEEAIKQTKKEAIRNTAIILGAVGTYMVAKNGITKSVRPKSKEEKELQKKIDALGPAYFAKD